MDGVLIVDKPQEWTSHDVCAYVRKRFKIDKVGHAGTLDPLATGVLVLLLGRATKSSQDLSACDKEYFGIMQLGVQTDTQDRSGKILSEKPWQSITLEAIQAKARSLTGEIDQTPPMVSALKHKGVRLYELARKGKVVDRASRKVTVYEFNIQKKEEAFVHFSAKVSKGTYLRTLIHDLGESLGTHGSLAELRRIRSGRFSLEDSVTIEQLKSWTFQDLKRRIFPLYSVLSYAHSLRS